MIDLSIVPEWAWVLLGIAVYAFMGGVTAWLTRDDSDTDYELAMMAAIMWPLILPFTTGWKLAQWATKPRRDDSPYEKP